MYEHPMLQTQVFRYRSEVSHLMNRHTASHAVERCTTPPGTLPVEYSFCDWDRRGDVVQVTLQGQEVDGWYVIQLAT